MELAKMNGVGGDKKCWQRLVVLVKLAKMVRLGRV